MLRLRIVGMDCADCAGTLLNTVRRLEGVEDANLNFMTATLMVTYRDSALVLEKVQKAVAEAGYSTQPLSTSGPENSNLRRRHLQPGSREFATLISGAGLAAGVLSRLIGAPEWMAVTFLALAILVGGRPVARAGWMAVRSTRSLDMNVLMTLAVLGAALIGEWTEGAAVVFLFSLGNLLEERTMERARRSIRQLMDLSPRMASRLRFHAGQRYEERVSVDVLEAGDRVVVKPGERVPMDGTVASGYSMVDQAPITGESSPVEKGPKDAVFAGTINGAGTLDIIVTRPATENTIARIVAMIEEAQSQKAPVQRFVDRFSRLYTPAVIALAALVALLPPLLLGEALTTWAYRALVLLVISCPCALVISTPVSIVSAITRAARMGILIKGGAYLELAGSVEAVAFDKTGTLTRGRPEVVDVIGLNGYGSDELLSIAAALESSSEHKLGRAIVHEAKHRGLSGQHAGGFQALAGQGGMGMVGGIPYLIGSLRLIQEKIGEIGGGARTILSRLLDEGKTVVLLARVTTVDGDSDSRTRQSHLVGILGLADQIRPGVAEALRRLKQAGVRHTIMLTGDNSRSAEAVAAQLDMDQVLADLLPEDKVRAVEGLLSRYGQVAMVGDGINDAPALARASLGIAMGAAGTDVALETADIALMSDDLDHVTTTIRLSRQARRIISQNITLALGLKGLFLVLAIAGMATLWMAVVADMGASLLVTLNGMRLLRAR